MLLAEILAVIVEDVGRELAAVVDVVGRDPCSFGFC